MSFLLPLTDLVPSKRLDMPDAPLCGRCKLDKGCITPKIKPYGKGRMEVLVCAEGPGSEEDQQGRPFVGKAGKCLRDELHAIGVDLDEDCWTINSVSCRPPSNAQPTEKQVYYCRPLVQQAINLYKPKAILLLGASAIQSVIALAWGKGGSRGKTAKVGGVNKWCGYCIPSQVPNAWIIPTYHPSHIMRLREEMREPPMEAFYWRKHLEQCFSISRRPWSELPDYQQRCKIVMDERLAKQLIDYMTDRDKPVSWDIETDRLKPDHKDASIICCSVSDGDVSIAFPWTRTTKEAMGELLLSSTPKWGWNVAMEHGWALKQFGHGVNNWQEDGMLNAHVLDNRPGTKSLKFQAFARLGQPSYDDEIKPYLTAETGNAPNKIRELTRSSGGWRKLLLYCACDSILEWELCSLQREELL